MSKYIDKLSQQQKQFYNYCVEKGLNEYIVKSVAFAFSRDLSIDAVKLFCSQNFSNYQVNTIFHGLANDKLSIDQVSIYADPILSHGQMNSIRTMLRAKVPVDQVRQIVALMKLQK